MSSKTTEYEMIDPQDYAAIKEAMTEVMQSPEEHSHFGLEADLAAWIQAGTAALTLYLYWQETSSRLQSPAAVSQQTFFEQRYKEMRAVVRQFIGEVSDAKQQRFEKAISELIASGKAKKTLDRLRTLLEAQMGDDSDLSDWS